MMNKNFFGQVSLLFLTSAILYYSGSYLKGLPDLRSFFDGLVVMTFFFSLIPFLTVISIFTRKFFKTVSNLVSY